MRLRPIIQNAWKGDRLMNEIAGEKAIVSLVLGILGIFVCFGIGIVAIIL